MSVSGSYGRMAAQALLLLTLFVLSGCGGGGSTSFNNVGDNNVPIIENVTVQNISTDGTKTYYFTTYDADGDTLDVNVTATNGSAVLSALDATSYEMAFTPSVDYIGYAVITINANDNNGGIVSFSLTIDETPNIYPVLNNALMSVNENTAAGTTIGTIGILDVGDTAISSIDLSGTGASNFLVSTSGVVTVAGGATLDYESATVYNLTAAATNDAGTGSDVNVTITVNDLADVVPILADETGSVNENAAAGTVVDTITIVTPGDRPISAITLSGTGASDFTVSTSGVISVASGALLDYESQPSYNLSAVATNAAGNSAPVSVTINLNNLADVPPTLAAVSGSVDEDATSGTPVLSIPIVSTGDTAITSITLSGTGSSNFTVSTAGVVSVASGALLDYETTTQYNLVASAANTAGSSNFVSVTVNVNNVPDVIPVLTDTTGSVDENATAGTVVTTITINPGDSAVTATELSGIGASNFDLSTAGVISVASGAALDYETITTYNLTARVLNSAGWSATANVTINVNNDPLLAPALTLSAANVPLLMIGIGFNDYAIEERPENWSEKLFGLSEGTLNDYFDAVSNGHVTLKAAPENFGSANDGVVLVTLPIDHPGNMGMDSTHIAEALSLADAYVDFSLFDADGDGTVSNDELQLLFVVAGGETSVGDPVASSVWARSDLFDTAPVADGVTLPEGYIRIGEKHGSHTATIGIIAHELLHARFGLPDLYDVDGSSAGIGYFGVMGSGLWGAKALENAGTTPVHPCAWSKLRLQWARTAAVDGSENNIEVNATQTEEYSVLKVETDDPQEYFLLENRSPEGYDAGLYAIDGVDFGGGIAIWHIDESISANSDDSHRLVDLEEANNAELDLDNTKRGTATNLYYAGNATRFDDTSSPDSKKYDGTSTMIGVENVSAPGTAGNDYRMYLDISK